MVSCVLLSAGESRRFGSPKALAAIGGTAAIVRLQQTFLDANIDEIIIVVGAHAETIRPHVFNHKKVRIVYNKDYKLGQTSSFQAGVSDVNGNATGIMLHPVDCPLVAPRSVACLAEHFQRKKPSILIPTCAGRRGHPPVFHALLKSEILSLSTSEGVNCLFERHTTEEIALEDSGVLKTFNTPEEFGQLF